MTHRAEQKGQMLKVAMIVVTTVVVLFQPLEGQRTPRVGERIHITGCENGELMLSVINMWDSPDMRGIVGKLASAGRVDQGLRCQGAVVIVHEIRSARGRIFIRIQTVVRGAFGWVTDSFIGREFDTAKCEELFGEDQEMVDRCKGARLVPLQGLPR